MEAGRGHTVSARSPNAQEIRPVLRRLARRARPPQDEVLPHKKGSAAPPDQDARPGQRKKSPRLGSVAQICEAWVEAHRRHSSIHVPARALAALAGSIRPHELTALHFETLVSKWRHSYARNTIASYTRSLRKLAEHISQLAGRPEVARYVPRVPHETPRTTIAQPQEITRLLTAAPGWMRCFLHFAVSLGLRLSDALAVAPANWNQEAHTITLRQKKTDRLVELPATPELEALLAAAPPGPAATPYVELLRGKTVTPTVVQKQWRRLKHIAQVNPDLWIHDLRRTSAVSLYELSRDLRVVEQFLGHASLSSTAQYLEHRDPNKLRPLLAELWRPKKETVQ